MPPVVFHILILLLVGAGRSLAQSGAQTGKPRAKLAVRAENFTHSPSTGPVTHVTTRNLGDGAFQGVLRVRFPEGWRVSPAEIEVALKPLETRRFPFTIERAVDRESNAYPVSLAVSGKGGTVLERRQTLVCASAPHYKPKIDGDLKEWAHSIPIVFTSGGNKTVVRTYWNKSQFCLAVEVEEKQLVPWSKKNENAAIDAVQFALAPFSAKSDSAARREVSRRYEFLAAAGGGLFAKDRCFQLLSVGDKILENREKIDLTDRIVKEAQVAVKRKKGVTYYEIAVPYSLLADLRPTTGRVFLFSVLVHDPDGTGVRNLGEVMGLFPSQRRTDGWSEWEGARWGDGPQWDTEVEWGLASSIY